MMKMNKHIKTLADCAANCMIDDKPVMLQYTNQFANNIARLLIEDVLSNVFDEVQYSTSSGIAREIDDKLKKYYGVD